MARETYGWPTWSVSFWDTVFDIKHVSSTVAPWSTWPTKHMDTASSCHFLSLLSLLFRTSIHRFWPNLKFFSPAVGSPMNLDDYIFKRGTMESYPHLPWDPRECHWNLDQLVLVPTAPWSSVEPPSKTHAGKQQEAMLDLGNRCREKGGKHTNNEPGNFAPGTRHLDSDIVD